MTGRRYSSYSNDLQFGVGVSGGGEVILHAVNRLIEGRRDDVGLSMLLVDFKNAFNLVDQDVMLQEVRLHCPAISRWIRGSFNRSLQAWYLDDDTIIGDTMVVGKEQASGVFPLNISRPLHGDKLLGGPASVDFNFSSELVMKRVEKTIVLMDTIVKINDPQCELLLLHASLERIVTASGHGFGDWQWRLSTLPFAFGGLGVYSAAFGRAFTDALCVFNTKMETDLLSNTSEIAARKLIKKLADIYFTRVTQTAEFTFSLSSRQIAFVAISNGRLTLTDWLMVVSNICFGSDFMLACSKVFTGDIYGDHAVSCAGIFGIKK
ncbi:hypothetical protein Tco_0639205 [Tanacetum coccineum]